MSSPSSTGLSILLPPVASRTMWMDPLLPSLVVPLAYGELVCDAPVCDALACDVQACDGQLSCVLGRDEQAFLVVD